MKKPQILITILPLLIAMMMFSVGFSTWTLATTTEVSVETSVSVTTTPIYGDGEMLSITELKVFDYSSLHFLDADNPSDTGSIVVSCAVNLDNYKQDVGEAWDGSITVRVDLLYTNLCLGDGESYDLFTPLSGEYQKSVSANLILDGNKTAASLVNNGSYVYATVTVTPGVDATGIYDFKVEFLFNIPMNKPGTEIPSNFRHTFGQYLKNKGTDKTSFVSTIRFASEE